MNGRKTLYIHIGTPKTGTTAIQGFCQDNAEELARHGYCFPDFTWLCPDFRSVRNGHFLVESVKDADGRVCAEAERQIFCRGMERIAELFRTYEAVILSDEGIWMATFERRKSLWRELAAVREEAGGIEAPRAGGTAQTEEDMAPERTGGMAEEDAAATAAETDAMST